MAAQRPVEIRDGKTGALLRETYVQDDLKFFGMFSAADMVKGAIGIIIGAIFLINNADTQKANAATLARLVDFRDNSDSFQTTAYGTRFRNGEPIDPNFKIPRLTAG